MKIGFTTGGWVETCSEGCDFCRAIAALQKFGWGFSAMVGNGYCALRAYLAANKCVPSPPPPGTSPNFSSYPPPGMGDPVEVAIRSKPPKERRHGYDYTGPTGQWGFDFKKKIQARTTRDKMVLPPIEDVDAFLAAWPDVQLKYLLANSPPEWAARKEMVEYQRSLACAETFGIRVALASQEAWEEFKKATPATTCWWKKNNIRALEEMRDRTCF